MTRTPSKRKRDYIEVHADYDEPDISTYKGLLVEFQDAEGHQCRARFWLRPDDPDYRDAISAYGQDCFGVEALAKGLGQDIMWYSSTDHYPQDLNPETGVDRGDIEIDPLEEPFQSLVAEVFGNNAYAYKVEYADLDRIEGMMGDQHLSIRMWDVTESAIRWTLFQDVSNGDGSSHGEELRSGDFCIKAGN